jgi:hypothetical protein
MLLLSQKRQRRTNAFFQELVASLQQRKCTRVHQDATENQERHVGSTGFVPNAVATARPEAGPSFLTSKPKSDYETKPNRPLLFNKSSKRKPNPANARSRLAGAKNATLCDIMLPDVTRTRGKPGLRPRSALALQTASAPDIAFRRRQRRRHLRSESALAERAGKTTPLDFRDHGIPRERDGQHLISRRL